MRGTYLKHKVYEIIRRISFDIEFASQQRTETVYVAAADMPLVGPGMDCDPVGAEPLYIERHSLDIRVVFPPCVA